MSITPYQGGVPLLYTRVGAGQRGAGFFSSLKRYLLPIGRALVPSAVGAVGDLMSGKSIGEIARTRGVTAGKRALGAAAHTLGTQFVNTGGFGGVKEEQEEQEAQHQQPPPKKYKKGGLFGRRSTAAAPKRGRGRHHPQHNRSSDWQ